MQRNSPQLQFLRAPHRLTSPHQRPKKDKVALEREWRVGSCPLIIGLSAQSTASETPRRVRARTRGWRPVLPPPAGLDPEWNAITARGVDLKSLDEYEVAAVQVAWLHALDKQGTGAVQRDQRAGAGPGAMRLKIREVSEVGFAKLDEILARIKPADGVSAGGVRGKVKVILSRGGVQCGASGRVTDELHTVATEDSRTRSRRAAEPQKESPQRSRLQ